MEVKIWSARPGLLLLEHFADGVKEGLHIRIQLIILKTQKQLLILTLPPEPRIAGSIFHFAYKRENANEFFIFCSESPNIVRMIKSKMLRCVGHVARMEESKGSFINYVRVILTIFDPPM